MTAQRDDRGASDAQVADLEGQLAEAQARVTFLEGVVSALHDTLVLGFDQAGVCKFGWADPGLAQGNGMDPSGMVGTRLFDMFPPEEARERLRRIQEVFEAGRPLRDEYAIQLPGGEFWHDITMAPMRDATGAVTAAVAVVRDITQRKRTELRLRESEERYRRLIDALPLGVVVHSGGRIAYGNPAATRMVGWSSPDEHLGSSVLDWVHPAEAEAADQRMQRIYGKDGHQAPMELRLVRCDGSSIDVEAVSAPVDWEGQPASQVLMTDITERKRADAERRALEQNMWQAQKLESLALLAGGVAHDFNNLLVAILGNADLALLELPPGTAARACVEEIELAARRAADLARQMLAYAGRGKTVVGRMDLPLLLRETAKLIGAVISKKAKLSFEFLADIPLIEGDATQIRQVAMNLITNASDALAPEGGTITVSTGVQDCDREALRSGYVAEDLPPGRYVFLEIRDTGSGMSPEVLPRIFDPFFSTKVAGRGLGLAAVLGIVRAHRGTIQVQSRPGQGSSFRLLFPAAGSEVSAGEPRHESRAQEGRRPQMILLVDDEEVVRNVTARMLKALGFGVVVASDGATAVALLAQRPEAFDCVLLDVTMPEMGGRETLLALRRIRPDLKAVLCSGHGRPGMDDLSADGPPPAFLAKPFSSDELTETLRRALE
jgi:two-component system cell cycle sensor histidine kinase/response regulator CckA